MPVQVFLVKWIPPAHPTPQACPSGWGGEGGAGREFWILIQFLLRAITVSLQATQAAGYVCTEDSAVGGETKGKETGGGRRFYAPSHVVPQTGSKTVQIQNLAFLKQVRGK